jgi:DNA replication protein DnaC
MERMRFEVPDIAPERIVPEPAGVCPECRGRGWKVMPDGGAGRAEVCECRKRERGAMFLAGTGIPERYRRCKLSNFETANRNPATQKTLVRARTASERYVKEFLKDDGSFCEAGLIYVGPPGLGKTHLAAAVLAEVVSRYNLRGRFIDFTSLIQQIQATFDPSSGKSKRQVLDPVIQAELLVFDELGAQKPTEWVMDTLYYILNTRYTQRLPTIFTTNFPLDRSATAPAKPSGVVRGSDADVAYTDQAVEKSKARRPAPRFESLEDRLSVALVSRLYQMAQSVELMGLDYRREVKAHEIRIVS